jgi:glycosyltransferase involved in cell wall biosynthesis
MRIAYLVNQYPKVSHVFIRREILALERRGIEVMRIALRGWDGEVLVDQEDEVEREHTRYVLREGAPALLLALTRMLLTRPLRLLRALGLAWNMSHRSERSRVAHFIYLAEACRIEPWLRAAGIQHVHAHFGTNSAEVAMLVHALGGPPWSFTVHGPEEFDKAPSIGLAEKVRRCDFVVAVSSFGRSQIYRIVDQQHWPKVNVVRCGLEAGFFAATGSPPPDVQRLVCVGRLCEQKGQLLLVEATRRLAAQGLAFQLVLVGDGEMRTEIEALIQRYGLQSQVLITGHISSAQLREEILAARGLVLPSFAEGLPMVIMEAMALKRPVISTFIAGIPELVQPGEHGWLVPAGDVDALTHAMQACLEAPADALMRMGETAYQRALVYHSVDKQAAQLAKLFYASVENASHAPRWSKSTWCRCSTDNHYSFFERYSCRSDRP